MRISDWSSDVCLPISASAAAAPEKLPALYDAIDGIVADLRDKPIGDDELHRAREPMVERFRPSLKTNRGWYGMMLAAAYSPETINDALNEVEVVPGRSDERRVGKECVRTCRSRVSAHDETKKTQTK